MRRFPVLGALLLVPAFALVFLVGCPAPTKDKPKPPDGAVDPKPADKKPGAAAEITTETEGTFKGVIKFKGTPPEPKKLAAIDAHKNAKECLAGGGINVIEQEWIISKDGKVANVLVSLAPPSGKKFKITDDLKKMSKEPAVMDQPFCQYIPHIVAVYAGVQPLIVKNTAEIGHNVKIVGTKNKAGDYNLEPKTGVTPPLMYEKESGPINISCSVHGWMTAKLWTFDNPYFAVSKEDGSFEIKNAPIGEELSVWLWHESKADKWEAQKITLKKGDNTVDLEIGAK